LAKICVSENVSRKYKNNAKDNHKPKPPSKSSPHVESVSLEKKKVLLEDDGRSLAKATS
jgi:hypothetical protein